MKIAPRKGLTITNLLHDTEFIVRDGRVIDKNYMEIGPGEQRVSVGKHHAHWTVYLHLLPIYKKNINANVTPSSSGDIRSQPDYALNVMNFIKMIDDSTIQSQCIYILRLFLMTTKLYIQCLKRKERKVEY